MLPQLPTAKHEDGPLHRRSVHELVLGMERYI